MFRRLYQWTLDLGQSRHALWALFCVSFAESSFFPIPPDVMLVPMVIARPQRAWTIAALCTLGSVTGGILGYAIGALLYDSVGQWLIHLYGYGDKMDAFRVAYAHWGAWIILLKGLTPIPFKLVTIASGLAGYSFGLFILFSTISRAAKYFLLAALLRAFGEPIRSFIEKRLEWVMLGLAATIIGGFVLAAHFAA